MPYSLKIPRLPSDRWGLMTIYSEIDVPEDKAKASTLLAGNSADVWTPQKMLWLATAISVFSWCMLLIVLEKY